MKVYAVFSGEYDEWDIEGVYSTMERAEHAKRLFGPRGSDIIEIELDETPPHPDGMLQFSVVLDERKNFAGIEEESCSVVHRFPFSVYLSGKFRVIEKIKYFTFRIFAKDEEDAKEKALAMFDQFVT